MPNSSRRWRWKTTSIPGNIKLMRRTIVLTGLTSLALAVSAGAATLNKCIDAKGEVTYSNLPCRNAKEVRRLEIDAEPQPAPVRAQPVQAQANQPAKPARPSKEPAPIHIETRSTTGRPVSHASARQCDTLSDKLGRVFDKMDLARRNGYTQEQMDKWNLEVKELERKKQQSGCF